MSDTELAVLADTLGKKSPTTGTKDIEDGDSSFTRKKKKKASKGKGKHHNNLDTSGATNSSPKEDTRETVRLIKVGP